MCTDDQGLCDIGRFGGPRNKTPKIERIEIIPGIRSMHGVDELIFVHQHNKRFGYEIQCLVFYIQRDLDGTIFDHPECPPEHGNIRAV